MNTLEDLIRKKAYEIWETRQRFGYRFRVNRAGQLVEISAQDDWLEAKFYIEQEVRLGEICLK